MKWKLDSKRECSKRQEVKVSLPSPGARIYHPAITAIIFYWSRSPRVHPRFKGRRHSLSLSVSGLAKRWRPSLIHYVAWNHKSLKTTNLHEYNMYQQLCPQTGAQLSYIRNSWPSEPGLLLLVYLPKTVPANFSLNGLFTPEA